jgi:hypothetical protein
MRILQAYYHMQKLRKMKQFRQKKGPNYIFGLRDPKMCLTNHSMSVKTGIGNVAQLFL